MKTHELKTWPVYFREIERGAKTFEWRKDDRDFKVGDQLVLCEWDDGAKAFTGQRVRKTITYIARGVFGIPDGYAILALGAPYSGVRSAAASEQAGEVGDGD